MSTSTTTDLAAELRQIAQRLEAMADRVIAQTEDDQQEDEGDDRADP